MSKKPLVEVGKTYLVNSKEFFRGDDGRAYQAVWGTLNGIVDAEEMLGIKTNRNTSNWYVDIGNMQIAGCQVHQVIRCDTCNFGPVEDCITGEVTPSRIYNANQAQLPKEGKIYAVKAIDNSGGDEIMYRCLARYTGGEFVCCDNNRPLVEYVGDEILGYWEAE